MSDCIICGQKAMFRAVGRITPKKTRRLYFCTRHLHSIKYESFEIRVLDDKGRLGPIYNPTATGPRRYPMEKQP